MTIDTIIAKINHEIDALKARPPGDGEFSALRAMQNASDLGGQLALERLLLWIAEMKLTEAIRA